MHMLKHVYKTVRCNGDFVTSNIGRYDLRDNFGHTQINEHIVPNSFIDFVADALSDTTFLYGEVLPVRDYVSDDLWESLDGDERAVLGAVIILLLDQGRVALEFQTEECDCENCSKVDTMH